MTYWHWLTKKLPLLNDRDVLARMGFRFMWCTGLYFVVAWILAAFGHMTLLVNPGALMIIAIPFAGGMLDWHRVHRKDYPGI